MKKTKNVITGIYKITSPSGKIYIGQTTNWKKRLSYYKYLNCKGQKKLYGSLQKYSSESHRFEIIEECSAELLNEREIYWGDYYNVLGKNGLNIKPLGVGGKWSEEMKLKAKERCSSPEYKAYVSKLQKGRKRSKEFSEFIGNLHRGTKRSEETKLLIGKGHKGLHKNLGSHRTDEQKANMSKAAKGKPKSLEARTNMSLAIKGTHTKKIICITTGVKYKSTNEASEQLGISSRSINNILSGLAKQTRNKLTFKYL